MVICMRDDTVFNSAFLYLFFLSAVTIADAVEKKYRDMKDQKRLAELTSEIWAEWHQARSNRNPKHYADVLEHEQAQEKSF